jgi:hypothetical protein
MTLRPFAIYIFGAGFSKPAGLPLATDAPRKLGWMSGFWLHHAFQVATPCLSNATCSSFAIESISNSGAAPNDSTSP